MTTSKEEILRKRDIKVKGAMQDWAPIWLINEQVRPQEDVVLFNLVYQHPGSGWINERFKFDAFNGVLYHMGSKELREEETLPIVEEAPFLDGEVATRVPNTPGPR